VLPTAVFRLVSFVLDQAQRVGSDRLGQCRLSGAAASWSSPLTRCFRCVHAAARLGTPIWVL